MTEKYNSFYNIENPLLRTWNRCSMMYNIYADRGLQEMQEYVCQFSGEDKTACINMFNDVIKNGYDKVRSYINRQIQEDRVVH